MEVYTTVKWKRKDLEDFNDDFSDFSLSSPARKIRRLDAELPPIVEEDEPEMYVDFEQSPVEDMSPVYSSSSGPKIEEISSELLNEERAIVLFKPNNSAPTSILLSSPSKFSISVSPQILSEFKNSYLLSNKSNPFKEDDDEDAENSESDSRHLAVIPWTPSQPSFAPVVAAPLVDKTEMMDAREVEDEEEAMDVDDVANDQSNGMMISDGFHQWQQKQHFLVPPPSYSTISPIVWYR